jgi:hypothetical protein
MPLNKLIDPTTGRLVDPQFGIMFEATGRSNPFKPSSTHLYATYAEARTKFDRKVEGLKAQLQSFEQIPVEQKEPHVIEQYKWLKNKWTINCSLFNCPRKGRVLH